MGLELLKKISVLYEILQKLQRPVNPLAPLPIDNGSHIATLVAGMCDVAGDNVLSGIYLLGMFNVCIPVVMLLTCMYLTFVCVFHLTLVGYCLATKVFIGKLPATGGDHRVDQ